jgi:hypothetical protein
MVFLSKKCLLLLLVAILRCNAFVIPHDVLNSLNGARQEGKWKQSHVDTDAGVNDLMIMDVVIFSEKESSYRKLGAVQDDGRITPLSVWTLEPAFGNSLEFLVDEEDLFPGFSCDQIELHAIVPQNLLSYGSRQVGGGMGPGNPHGEESELLYYVDRSLLSNIELSIKPELEIFW